jgi:hypothetical protein
MLHARQRSCIHSAARSSFEEKFLVNNLLPFWNYRLSSSLTLLTGVLLLWQYPGAKGTIGHVMRWAAALFLSVFVVYMNTVTGLNQPRVPVTNLWHLRFMEFHQNVGLIYFALMAAMPFLGGSLMVAVGRRWRSSAALRATHKYLAYAAGICWLVSNIASEFGSRIPRT